MRDVLFEQLDVIVLIVVFELLHREAGFPLEEADHFDNIGLPSLELKS